MYKILYVLAYLFITIYNRQIPKFIVIKEINTYL